MRPHRCARGADPSPPADWYRQPVVWLAIAVFALLAAGSIAMLVLGARHTDEPVASGDAQILKMPLSRAPPQDAPR